MSRINLGQVKWLTGIFGLLYLIGGIIEVLAYFGKEIKVIGVPTGDLFAAFALFTISAVYLTGLKRAVEGDLRSVSYLYVGALLSIGLALIAVLVMGSDAIEAYLLHNEDFAGWSPLDDVTTYLVLGVLSVIAYLPVKDVSKNPIKVRA
ncbi:hypothetical membrane protein, conserved [Thermococcus kodakarensis KOD1]|uniref:Hypothetical membrane protein, conserved n=1 Tax=Thermococcus kodakarensis (strain ATCC BAA-918 / JCM 12380 / KOD1) TaxID=69014 RepID=Q5JG51_THEKO|nr:hypothetical protein [Thermococcus kodakarensis]WCN28741.1 hypothetical protein POG15_03640 [Thermococcus kodakarensis]WCN31038.1 hypothetical protein POG21_03640 [Thermococcus kodakarensis]BAD84902.1 hypothetical membrane protein, conserved [Thermococcus kodakarensis KOD1]